MTGKGKFASQKSEERWGGPLAVPTNNWSAAGLMLAHGALGMRYIHLAPVSAFTVSEGVVLGGRVGLHLELGKNRIRSNCTFYI